MASQQKRHHWDKRKRRYIQLQPKEEVKAGKRLKTESGARTKSDDGPSGLYQKWAKAHKRRVATPGEEENGAAAAYSKNLSNRWVCAAVFACHCGFLASALLRFPSNALSLCLCSYIQVLSISNTSNAA